MTDEIQPVVQTANQPLDMTPSVAVAVTSSPAESVDIAANELRKALENDAKQHINSIWQKLESFTKEHLDSLIFDLKKHV